MTTVAIPAEIVGDHETIRARRQECRDRITSNAVCLGRQNPRTTGYHLRTIVELTALHDMLQAEAGRRWRAYELAHSGVDG